MRDAPRKLLIFGASGHAKVVIDVVEKQGCLRPHILADDNPELHGQLFYGYHIIGGRQELQTRYAESSMQCLVAIGSNHARAELALWLQTHGFILAAPAVHPSAQIARGAEISAGSILMAGCVVNSDTAIGSNVIVNTGATIDHDCVVGDAAHIAPGVTLCGNVRVGMGTLVGAGAVIHPNITIGNNVIIGAGATVLRDVPDGKTVVGTPARIIR